jgi:putative DNA primase/helicase
VSTPSVRLVSDADIAKWKPKPDLVKGLLAAKEVNMLFAPKNRGKTFLGLDLAYSIATGLDTWLGQRITEHGSVVYLCAEGRNGLPKRRAAWFQVRQPGFDSDIPTLKFVDGVTDIRDHDQIAALVAEVREHCPDVVLIIVDTLSQHLPGGDEGTADMSAALHQCQYLRDALDTTVLAMHHPTKANEDNERGGSGFRGGCADVLNIAEKGGVFTLQSQNARDRGKDLTVSYVLDVVTLEGVQFCDDEGKQFTSCVPKLVDAATPMHQRRQDAETDRLVSAALTDTPQSAKAIRETAKRKDKAVRDALNRLKDQGRAENVKGGWVRAA